MNTSFKIRVGIKTFGTPRFWKEGETTYIDNLLIGDGFHWQNTLHGNFYGKIEEYNRGNEYNINHKIDDHVTLINTIPLETYIECVVGSEMNPAAPKEFIKAHAIISRSWAIGKILKIHPCSCQPKKGITQIIGWDDTGSHEGFDVCSDDHCQRYQGIQNIPKETLKAIRETEGLIITDQKGELADARFSKCCGGETEIFSTCWQQIDFNYLRSFNDPWCSLSNLSSFGKRTLLASILKDYDVHTEQHGYKWEYEISKKEIRKNLINKFGIDVGEVRSLHPLHRGPSGRIDLLSVIGDEKSVEIGKELWTRRLLSTTHLYSSAFNIEDLGNKVKLKGKGWGHGVGLCQIGAANMAANGFKYDEILNFYYPETIITKITY